MIVGIGLSLINQWSGINAVNFYAVVVFDKMAKGSFHLINLFSVLDGLLSMIASAIAGGIISKYGRRAILLQGNAVCLLSLLSLAAVYVYSEQYQDESYPIQISVTILLFTFIISFSMSLGPVFWVLIYKIY